MRGQIVYNGFWNQNGAPRAVNSLVHAAQKIGMTLTPVANTALYASLGDGVRAVGAEEAFALFWDKDVRLARAMEAQGVRLYNRSQAVAACDDKAATQLVLCREGIPMPQTWVAPMTYVEYDEAGEQFLCEAEEALSYPLVVKECFGSLGGQVYLARTPQELRALVKTMHARPFLLQRFIASSAGTDIRLYVVGSEVVAAMTRRNEGDFRANVGAGGHGTAYTPTQEEKELALRCCRLLHAEIAGVDLLHDETGSALVCEVNSSAQTAALSACTGIDVDEHIVRYVMDRQQAGV